MSEQDQTPTTGAGAPDSAADNLKKLEAERDEYLNGWKRSQADFINYKKEEARRFEEISAFATGGLVKDLLSVLDSFSLAQNSLRHDEAAQKGILLVQSQFEDILKKRGVEKITVKPGDELDVRLHEPMCEVELNPNDEKEKDLAGKVVEEVVAGYTMQGRVIRPVKVRIGKHEIPSTKSETNPNV